MTDVLVTQIAGSKEWVLWQPDRKWPLDTDASDRIYARDNPRVGPHHMLGRHVLYSGDTLYVPRGVLHEAITTDTMSLHLAFGLNVHRWYDVIEAAARQAVTDLAANDHARQALPTAFHTLANYEQLVPPELDIVCDQVANSMHAGLAAGLETVDRRYLNTRNASRPGQLTDIAAVDTLEVSSRLVRRAELAYGVSFGDDRIRLSFHNKTLSLDTSLRPALDFVCNGSAFSVGAIPGLDDGQRLQFSKRLLTEGFLTQA
jgi:ribosomal protein L16 Arg81 hydroxylase